MGFSLRELIRAIVCPHFPVCTLPATFARRLPQLPLRCLPQVMSLSRHFRYYSAVRLLIRLRFPLRSSLIGSLILSPHRNRVRSPGVTHGSSVPCCPHTPWFDGRMRAPSPPQCKLDLFPSLADRFILAFAFDYGPVLLRMPFGFHLAVNTLPSDGSFPHRPARHYSRFWIWRPSSEHQRDFNPPDPCAARRTL